MNTAIHAHPTQGVVDACRVSSQRNPPLGERRGNALMDAVKITVNQIVWRIIGIAFGEPGLIHSSLSTYSSGASPNAGNSARQMPAMFPRYLDHGAPLFWMGDIVAVTIPGRFFEIVVGGHDDEAFRPG